MNLIQICSTILPDMFHYTTRFVEMSIFVRTLEYAVRTAAQSVAGASASSSVGAGVGAVAGACGDATGSAAATAGDGAPSGLVDLSTWILRVQIMSWCLG